MPDDVDRIRDATTYEAIYREAAGDSAAIPWSDGRPSPGMISWLDGPGASFLRPGAPVVVVACGLGEDARGLIARGFDVTAFDVSPTAVQWARHLDPDHRERYIVADLFDLPAHLIGRFELVVEINTIQAVEIPDRPRAVAGIAALRAPEGRVLVIARHALDPVSRADGPPWPLTTDEMCALFGAEGLSIAGDDDLSVGEDPVHPGVRRLHALFSVGE